MRKIPTAKDFWADRIGRPINPEEHTTMIAFAKFHVESALKEASEKSTVTPIDYEEIFEGSFRPIWGVDDESILTAYPIENIK